MTITENKELKKCFEIAENFGWTIMQECDTVYDFGKFSPMGQDFHMSIDTEDDAYCFADNLREYCNGYDVSYETYLWLDDSGHGANGAPYDMKDLYEDMEACLEMMEELAEEIEQLDFDEDEEE